MDGVGSEHVLKLMVLVTLAKYKSTMCFKKHDSNQSDRTGHLSLFIAASQCYGILCREIFE